MKLIPQPKNIRLLDGVLIPGRVYADDEFGGAADAYDAYRKKLYGKLSDGVDIKALRADNIQKGGYRIEADDEIRLYASDCEGMNNAFATLLQLGAEDGNVQKAVIDDTPDCSYRGVMIDLARIWHPFDYLLSYVDLCRFYKFSTLHLHFSDSQSYTLPSEEFPKLSTPNRHYTFEQIQELNRYAAQRSVKLMPEIDVPGHCDPFISAYPEIFGSGHIIDFTEEAIKAFDKLLSELCRMFPQSETVHIGGDEADIKSWLSNTKTVEYAKKCGIEPNGDERLSSERILALFVKSLSDIIIKNGKTPIVWEGFCKDVNSLVSRDTVVMSWENFYQTTPELVQAGYTLINSSWNPNYIVSPGVMWSLREVFDWDIFTFKPVHPGSPYIGKTLKIEETDLMTGGQLLSWGDFGAASDEPKKHILTERANVTERAAAVAENTWNKHKLVSFEEFETSFKLQNKLINGILNYTELKTERLVLRPIYPDDADAVYAYTSEYENVRYMLFPPNTRETAADFVNDTIKKGRLAPRTDYDFAVTLDGVLIGTCGIYLNIEKNEGMLGWILNREYWKNGYMTEAGKAMMKFGFETLGLHRIYSDCYTENYGSYRVMENLGMRREGEFKQYHRGRKCDSEKWYDAYFYAILKEEYEAKE